MAAKRKYGGVLIHESRDHIGIIEVVEDDFHRSLHFGSPPKQSSMRLDDPVSLALGYTRAMMATLLFQPEPRSVLLIGLGGASLARFLLHHFPSCLIDAVEYREAVVKLARGYFRLPDDPRLHVVVADGARFVRETQERRYDLILVDAFDDAGMVDSVGHPAFFDACRALMAPGGAFAANLWLDRKGALEATLEHIDRAFEGNLLRLPVPGKGNLVALATDKPAPVRQLKRRDAVARTMSQRYDIEFPVLLKTLRKANRGWFF